MPRTRIQLLGSTRLARVVLHYVLERRACKVVGVDPGEEDESRPWFAPLRGLVRDHGVPLGRADADIVIDCDPDARPVAPEGVGLRVCAPPGMASADPNRMVLSGAAGWHAVVTDGRTAWAARPLEADDRPGPSGDDAETVLAHATVRLVEALDEGWDAILAGPPGIPLPTPLHAGRWRPQESWIVWDLPASALVRRIRAASGPWGGARTHLGETVVWLEDAVLVAEETPEGYLPGTIVEVGRDLVVATGRGLLRVSRLRPAWRPARPAGDFVRESGLSEGYLLA